jgi:hypothetical protein
MRPPRRSYWISHGFDRYGSPDDFVIAAHSAWKIAANMANFPRGYGAGRGVSGRPCPLLFLRRGYSTRAQGGDRVLAKASRGADSAAKMKMKMKMKMTTGLEKKAHGDRPTSGPTEKS